MYKKANSPPPYWQSILTKIRNLGLRPEIMAMLNNFNQIVWESSPPADEPNAVAYVSNEDKNGDGKIDKIHFVLSKFPPNANEEEMDGIVEMVAKTLVHEYGHIEDFNPETGEFPGGEGAAEQAERAFEPLLKQKMEAMKPANNNDLFGGMSAAAKAEILKDLVKLSNSLDERGLFKEANFIDSIIQIPGQGEFLVADESCQICNASPCGCKSGPSNHLGNFSNLNKTNIKPDEAFSAGITVCEDEHKSGGSYMAKPQLANIEDKARSINSMIAKGEEIDDWMEAYIAQADKMLTDIEHKLVYKKSK